MQFKINGFARCQRSRSMILNPYSHLWLDVVSEPGPWIFFCAVGAPLCVFCSVSHDHAHTACLPRAPVEGFILLYLTIILVLLSDKPISSSLYDYMQNEIGLVSRESSIFRQLCLAATTPASQITFMPFLHSSIP